MPIQVEDYVWTQSSNSIQIKVPLKGVNGSKVNIFSTDGYIKASYAPYIFEVFLHALVDDSRSKAIIRNGQITFELEKSEDETWPQLQDSRHKEKEFAKEKRHEAVLIAQQRAKEESERKAREKDQQKKFAVKQQMRVEEEERQKIKQVKDAETEAAMRDLEAWKNSNSTIQETINTSKAIIDLSDEAMKANGTEVTKPKSATEETKAAGGKIFEAESIPAPRSTSTIQLHFTPRAFVTPSRESKAPEEQAWLEKVAVMKKVKGDTQQNEDLEGMDPVWLQEKGNGFYKQGNFIAAINAFTAAIVLNGTDPSLYNNRGACHLQMKQFSECIQDATMAIELLDPPVPLNAKSRCIALIRRGTAYFQMENFIEALSNYEAALKIDPSNESVRQDAEKIRSIIQGT